jgi:Pentapeptide repeats (8 copies)
VPLLLNWVIWVGELACGEIFDLDGEVERCGGLEICIPQGECGIVDVVNGCWRGVMSYYGSKRQTTIGDDDLRELYAAGERDFSRDQYRLDLVDPGGTNLSGANFRGANLADVNFYHVNFSNSDLSNAMIVASSLEEVILKGTILNGARLGSTTLRGCDLTDASLIEANLREIKLINSNLTRANLTGANIEDARFEGNIYCETIMPNGTIRTDTSNGSDCLESQD